MILHVAKHVERLSNTIKLIERFDPNLILVEGYKDEAFPKIVLVKEEKDRQLLDRCKNVIAVVTWLQPFKAAVPVFSITNEQQYLSYIINQVRGLT
ncbi:molybdopterin-guanine dinucleotide biosynthesis protein B [Bacillus sp. JCM 19034]|uniref:molybdopterin-guanine dinucleotide biosynthesis protein B n=1 Tax=Bacillus sp. JCM 19034 TaxID=1481928 RepID=UPI0007849BAA|nr:molybdopterin-guanine dinucleotide biosynthesis protein MobB [Bacillus sp. JCM 19034]